MTYTVLLLTVLFAQTTAQAPTPITFAVNAQKSVVRYTIVHKLHTVHGESRLLQGKAVLKPDGILQVMIRAPIGSFQSGDGNRDAHMRETMEESKYPYFVYKGVSKLTSGSAALPPKHELALEGELDFHGRKRPEKVSIHLDNTNPAATRATGHFVVSLERYQVERPSLLLIKIDDACAIDLDLYLTAGAH